MNKIKAAVLTALTLGAWWGCGAIRSGVAASEPVVPSTASAIALHGVRPGMTKEQALAALRAPPRGLLVREYFSGPGNGYLGQYPRSRVRPTDTMFFSRLIGVAAKSETEFDQIRGSLCMHGGEPRVIVEVLFTPDLRKPLVALVDEQKYYCSGTTPVKTVVEGLYRDFSRTTFRTAGLREDGVRLQPDIGMTDGAGMIEWRPGQNESLSLGNRVDVPMMDVWGRYRGFGNPGAGIAINAQIAPKGAGSNYINSVRTVLWDETAMFKLQEHQQELMNVLDRDGLTVADFQNKAAIEKVMHEVSYAR